MISILAAVIVLGILIMAHELGHFLSCKMLGVGVEKFSIGFGPPLWSSRRGETTYQLSAFPIGGFVKMVGENPDDEVTAADAARSFTSKPVGVRAAVVAAGPIFNLLLAVAIFAVSFMIGVPSLDPVVGQVQAGSPAEISGIKEGDRFLSLNGSGVIDWEDLTEVIHGSAGVPVTLTIQRDGGRLAITVTPKQSTIKNIFGEETTIGLIGISPKETTFIRRYSPWRATVLSLERTWAVMKLTIISIVKIFQRIVPAKSLGGPLMIAQMAGEQAKSGVMGLIFLIAFLSINLGLFNLFPIPILDGGHLLFFLIEIVRGRPLSIKKRELVQQIGLFLLVSLMLFASYNDIVRWAGKYFAK